MRQGKEGDDLDQIESVIKLGNPVDSEHSSEAESMVEATYPVDRLKARINRSLGERPVMVYLVLVAGAATLLLLLAIVWISATGSNPDERPICTVITADEASDAIMANQVERINILVDSDNPLQTLTGLVLEFTDGACRQPAQGADVRGDLYQILGVVEIYNNFGEQRVRLHYQRQTIQQALLVTSTPTPTPTPVPTDTPTVGITDTVVAATPEPTLTSTVSPPPPVLTPSVPAAVASPASATPSATVTATSSASPSIATFATSAP